MLVNTLVCIFCNVLHSNSNNLFIFVSELDPLAHKHMWVWFSETVRLACASLSKIAHDSKSYKLLLSFISARLPWSVRDQGLDMSS